MKTSVVAAAAFLAVTAAGSWWLFRRPGTDGPLNVLVVSACSLRNDRIGVLNPSSRLSPRIDEWAKGAYVFTNAIAEKPWQNFTFEATELITRPELARLGYSVFRKEERGHHFIIPPPETTAGDEEWFWDEDAILHYRQSFDHLRRTLTRPRERPIYAFTHLKYMHYPYLDRVNWGPEELALLSPKSRELVARYTADPAAFPDRLPAIEVMLNSFDLLKKMFNVKGKVLSVSGVISDPSRTRQWMQAPGYEDDLRLIHELYDLKMRHFDGMAAEVLNLFGDPRLLENTVVIFTGDHGEALMDHGVLGHSVNVYDEMLRHPLMVKFPGGGGEEMPQQITHAIMAEITKKILEGQITRANFAEEVRKRSADYVMARNCQGDIRTVRYRSEWKFIKNLSSGKNELYNLKDDPKETRDLAADNPDMAWKLEEYMINNMDQFKRTNRRELKTMVCLPSL